MLGNPNAKQKKFHDLSMTHKLRVYVDTVNGFDGLELAFNGTDINPVKTLNCAKVIAEKIKADEIVVDGVVRVNND